MPHKFPVQASQSQPHQRDDRALSADSAVILLDAAVTIYGAEARTAVAYCGLDAWFEGNDDEFRQWASLYRQFSN